MKKILIDLERLRYPNSGIANIFRNLSKGIESDIKYNDISFQYFGEEKSLKEFLPTEKIVKRKIWHKFYDNFSESFDIVHASHQLSSYFHQKYDNTIKIITLHDLNFLYENKEKCKRDKVLKLVNKNLRNADYIVCISNFVKNDLLKNKDIIEIDKCKEIFVVYNGVKLPEDREYDLGEYHYLKNKNYILNIGVLFEKKNQKVLIEMLKYIDEDLVLIASGSKKYYANLIKNTIKELGLEKRVHILANISEEQKNALIQNSIAMCHPSFAEGFGIPPIEAMMFGKPIFLSSSTCLPEIGGDVAFYFNDFNPYNMSLFFKEKMLEYNKDRENMERKLKAKAKEYEIDKMLKGYYEIYKKILTTI